MKIVIADDDLAVLRQWIVILKDEFDVIAAARDGLTALQYIRRYVPEVAILDFRMPSLDGFEVARHLRHANAPTAVVICSIETDIEFVEAAKEAGALGYVFKYSMVRDLVRAVKAAAQGEAFISGL